MLGKITAAYENEDILATASRRHKKNLLAGVSLETIALTLTDSQISFGGSTVAVKGTCYLVSYAEALKALKLRKFVTLKQMFISEDPYSFKGKIINCYPALVDYILKGGSLEKSCFFRDVPVREREVLREPLAEVEGFKQVYDPNAKKDDLLLLSNLNPLQPLLIYDRNGKHYSFFDEPLRKFSPPVEITAVEVSDLEYSSAQDVKRTDGATDNINRTKKGIVTLDDAQLVVQGVHHDILEERLADTLRKAVEKKLKLRQPLTALGDRWLFPVLGLGPFEAECVRAHIDIHGEAPLQLGVYGTVKDDGPH